MESILRDYFFIARPKVANNKSYSSSLQLMFFFSHIDELIVLIS